jgi:hypothetical protein
MDKPRPPAATGNSLQNEKQGISKNSVDFARTLIRHDLPRAE